MPDLCPVCHFFELKKGFERDVITYSCRLCGEFTLPRDFVENEVLQQHKNGDVKIRYALGMIPRTNKIVELSKSMIEEILAKPLPRPQEQADLLIRWFAEHSDNPGDQVQLDLGSLLFHLPIIGAKTAEGFILVLSHLIKIGLVNGELTKTRAGDYESSNEFALTFEGWNYYETLLKGSTTYRKAFMAMKFGNKRLNSVLEDVFKPSAKMAGFDLFKLDDEPRAGLIDDRLRVEIQSSAFLVADLTHANNGAYWEAGYAEGLGKPVIYTCEKEKFKSQKTHFDTNHHLTVIWDKNAPELAGDLLKATIRATLPHLAKLED